MTEAFILALEDEEKQEICNSLNRRTEFKVLRTTYKLFDTPAAPPAAIKEEIEDSLKQEGADETIEPQTLEVPGRRGNRELREGEETTEDEEMSEKEEIKRLEGMKQEIREKYEEGKRTQREKEKQVESMRPPTERRRQPVGSATKKDEEKDKDGRE